jgi:hypothetical protein
MAGETMSDASTLQDTHIQDPRTLMRWIRLKASEFIIQLLVVIVSIVLALAVDEWRDAKAQQRLVEQAQISVLGELKENRKELSESVLKNDSIFAILILHFKSKTARKEGISFSYAQLSSAAWQTAQGIKSLYRLSFPYLIKIAKVYEFQSLYNVNQSKLVGNIGDSWIGGKDKDLLHVQKKIAVQMATISQLGHALTDQYSEILDDSTSIMGR